MARHRWLKRSVAALLLALVAGAVTLTVHGLREVFAAACYERATIPPVVPATLPPPAPVGEVPSPRLERPAPISRPEPPTAPAPPAPESAPPCTFGRVVLIAAAEDDGWSFASFKPAQGRTVMRRQGERFEDHIVEEIAWDRVWLASDDGRCQMRVGDRPAPATAPRNSGPRTPKQRPRHSQLPPEVEKGIRRIDDGEFDVDRPALDWLMENYPSLTGSAHARPVRKDGEVVGWRLQRIRKGSLPDKLGLQRGDQLSTLNGFPTGNPEAMLQAYGRIRHAERIEIGLRRDGQPKTITINLR